MVTSYSTAFTACRASPAQGDVNFRSLLPSTSWEGLGHYGDANHDIGHSEFVRDTRTGRVYRNCVDDDLPEVDCDRSRETLRSHFFYAAVATPVVETVKLVVNVFFRLGKIVSHLADTKRPLKGRIKAIGKEMLRIVATPLALAAFQLITMYGLVTPSTPRDAARMHTTLSRLMYDGIPVRGWCAVLGTDFEEVDVESVNYLFQQRIQEYHQKKAEQKARDRDFVNNCEDKRFAKYLDGQGQCDSDDKCQKACKMEPC